MKKAVGVKCLSRAELETCLIEIEACINSRPLTFVGDTKDNPSPLTPSHFLIGRCAGSQLDVHNNELGAMKPQSLRDRFVLMEQRVELFWSVWTKDYLRNLPTTVVTAKQRCNLKVGSVVLVQDDNCPRLKWPLGIVIRMYPG